MKQSSGTKAGHNSVFKVSRDFYFKAFPLRLAQVGVDLHGLIHSWSRMAIIVEKIRSLFEWFNPHPHPQLHSLVLEKGKHKCRSSVCQGKWQDKALCLQRVEKGADVKKYVIHWDQIHWDHRVCKDLYGFSLLHYLNMEPISWSDVKFNKKKLSR